MVGNEEISDSCLNAQKDQIKINLPVFKSSFSHHFFKNIFSGLNLIFGNQSASVCMNRPLSAITRLKTEFYMNVSCRC